MNEQFEDLPVWRAAMDLAVRVYALTTHANFKFHPGLRDSVERAAVSISNNIAEGFERGTAQESCAFIYAARGSAGEVRSLLHLLERLPAFAELCSEVSNLRPLVENIARQLRGWIEAMQSPEIKGSSYSTEQTRRAAQLSQEREEFAQGLRQLRERHLARARAGGQQSDL
jgi:four helix bundle protein